MILIQGTDCFISHRNSPSKMFYYPQYAVAPFAIDTVPYA